MSLATGFLASGDVIGKLIVGPLPFAEVLWLRYVFFFAIAGSIAVWSRHRLIPSRLDRQILRGLAMLLSSMTFFLAFPFLPIAPLTAIFFTAPIFITALAAVVLHERVGRGRWIAAAVGLAGMLVIVRPGGEAFHWAAILPLIGAVCFAATMIISRLIGQDDPASVTLAYTGAVGVVLLGLAMPVSWKTPTLGELELAVAMGTCNAIGHGLIALGYRHYQASALAPYSYVQILWAGLLGYLTFGNAKPDVRLRK
jgi:drug/metabolite transporter (DMT)-like permease